MYDFREDIQDLQGVLQGLFEEVGEDFDAGINSVEGDDNVVIREKMYGLLKNKVEGLDDFRVKASLDVDPVARQEFLGEHSGLSKNLPFFVAFSLAVLSQRSKSLRGGTEFLFNDLRRTQNQRYHDMRVRLKRLQSTGDIVALAKESAFDIPDKVTIDRNTATGPFSLKIGLNFDAKYTEFNAKARGFLFGKEFKIKSQGMNETLKDRLRQTLANGYASGDSKAKMKTRVRSVLGPKSNAETIAITEVASAVNYGEYEFAKEFRDRQGVELIKTWQQIARTSKRKTHTNVAGQSLKFEEKFTVDGEPMDRPHDRDASARNVIRCGCYLDYEEGRSSIKGATDERGVRRYVESVAASPDEAPYVNAERIGSFKNVDDVIEYVRDIYGISVDEGFTIEQANSIASVLDAMPYEAMLKNLKLTEILSAGASAENIAEFALEGKWLRFGNEKELSSAVFEHALSHEIGHSLHYQFPELYEKFSSVSWDRVGEGNMFNAANWQRKTKGGFIASNSMKSPKEHFADSVAWYVTRNPEMFEVAKRQAQRGSPELMKIFELFTKHFGPVKP